MTRWSTLIMALLLMSMLPPVTAQEMTPDMYEYTQILSDTEDLTPVQDGLDILALHIAELGNGDIWFKMDMVSTTVPAQGSIDLFLDAGRYRFAGGCGAPLAECTKVGNSHYAKTTLSGISKNIGDSSGFVLRSYQGAVADLVPDDGRPNPAGAVGGTATIVAPTPLVVGEVRYEYLGCNQTVCPEPVVEVVAGEILAELHNVTGKGFSFAFPMQENATRQIEFNWTNVSSGDWVFSIMDGSSTPDFGLDEPMANATGNETGNATGNQTGNATGNGTGNETGGGGLRMSLPMRQQGNETGNSTGNQTGNATGNSTGNETATTAAEPTSTGNLTVAIFDDLGIVAEIPYDNLGALSQVFSAVNGTNWRIQVNLANFTGDVTISMVEDVIVPLAEPTETNTTTEEPAKKKSPGFEIVSMVAIAAIVAALRRRRIA